MVKTTDVNFIICLKLLSDFGFTLFNPRLTKWGVFVNRHTGVCLLVCVFVCWGVCLFVCLFVCLCVCLFVGVFVCLFVCFILFCFVCSFFPSLQNAKETDLGHLSSLFYILDRHSDEK